eukprot:scaffold72584_cov75-Phaeocystis_antarctica.AAC.4
MLTCPSSRSSQQTSCGESSFALTVWRVDLKPKGGACLLGNRRCRHAGPRSGGVVDSAAARPEDQRALGERRTLDNSRHRHIAWHAHRCYLALARPWLRRATGRLAKGTQLRKCHRWVLLAKEARIGLARGGHVGAVPRRALLAFENSPAFPPAENTRAGVRAARAPPPACLLPSRRAGRVGLQLAWRAPGGGPEGDGLASRRGQCKAWPCAACTHLGLEGGEGGGTHGGIARELVAQWRAEPSRLALGGRGLCGCGAAVAPQ